VIIVNITHWLYTFECKDEEIKGGFMIRTNKKSLLANYDLIEKET